MEPWFGVAFGLIVFSFFFGICWVHSLEKKRKNANFDQGVEALKRGDLDLALACANEEIRRESERARGYRLRGETLHRKGMHKEAIEDYTRCFFLTTEHSRLYRLRGDSYAALHRYDHAIADYSDAIRLNPDDTIAVEHRKVAYAEREARGNHLSNDLHNADAIITELPPRREENARATCDEKTQSQPIQRPAATKAISSPKIFNGFAMTGFILGLVSIVFYFIGIVPIVGIVFSAIGLARFNPELQKGKWMAGWGLGLSITYTVMFLTRR